MQTWEVTDVDTGETIGYNQTPIEQSPIVDTARQSALAKFKALGLTDDEVQALLGA